MRNLISPMRGAQFPRLLALLVMISLSFAMLFTSPSGSLAQLAAGVTITETNGSTSVTEGGATDSYTIVLDSPPLANVTIAVQPDGQVAVDKDSLIFTPLNWNVPQAVTVSAVDDFIAEGAHSGTIRHRASSLDPQYDGHPVRSVTVSITDNDQAGVTITKSDGSTSVAEGGAKDNYAVVLDSQPVADVTISIKPDAQVAVDKTSLTFTASNWNTKQVVTVTAADDGVLEGDHAGSIGHSSTSGDSKYNGIPIARILANITDRPAIWIQESGGFTAVVEGGAGDNYTIRLTAQPRANVLVSISPDGQLNVDKASLTFTPLDWDGPQTVTVSAVDDAAVEGPHTGTINHSSSSLDPQYNGIAVRSVTVSITDNEPLALETELEGPLMAVDVENKTITVMGITVRVENATFSSPTASLTLADLAGKPFPGRGATPGFINGTAIVTGMSSNTGGVIADDVFVEPAENVLLGPVTANTVPPGGSLGDDGTVFKVLGVEVRPIGDPRLPFEATILGLPVDMGTIPVGSLAGVEGYMGNDGIFYAFLVEADQGKVSGDPSQTSITRARCSEGGTLRILGASTTTTGSVTVFNSDTGENLGTTSIVADPVSGLGTYSFRADVESFATGTCPLNVRVENSNGSSATAEVDIAQ